MVAIITVWNGCAKDEGTNTAYPNVTAVADTIYGTLKYRQTDVAGTMVVAWPYGAATFKALVGSGDVLTSAPVNADGTFMLILPASVSGKYMASLAAEALRQGGTIMATPNTVRFLDYIQYKVEYTDNGAPTSCITSLYTLKADFSVDKSYYYNFYDLDGTFIGNGAAGYNYNWTFVKGWGMVESYKPSATSEAFNSKSISSIPASAVWVN